RTRADLAGRTTDVDGARGLVHVDVADLSDRARAGRRPVGQAAVVRSLDLGHGRRDGAVEQVDAVLAVELVPLTVVDRGAPRDVAQRIEGEVLTPVHRIAHGDVA